MELLARVNSHLRRYKKYLEAMDGKQKDDTVYVSFTFNPFTPGLPIVLIRSFFKDRHERRKGGCRQSCQYKADPQRTVSSDSIFPIVVSVWGRMVM